MYKMLALACPAGHSLSMLSSKRRKKHRYSQVAEMIGLHGSHDPCDRLGFPDLQTGKQESNLHSTTGRYCGQKSVKAASSDCNNCCNILPIKITTSIRKWNRFASK